MNSSKNTDCIEGRRFLHVNGKTYEVASEDGCFYDMTTSSPVYGKFGARSLRNDKPFGPHRMMLISNVAKWL